MIKLIVIFIIIILIIVCLNKYSKENFFFINRTKCKASAQRKYESCRQGVWPCCDHGNDNPNYNDWDTHKQGKCIKACDKVYNKFASDNACFVRGGTSIGLPLYHSDGDSWKTCMDNTEIKYGAGSNRNATKLPCPIICTDKGTSLQEGEDGFINCLNKSLMSNKPELLDECTRQNACFGKRGEQGAGRPGPKTIPMLPSYKTCARIGYDYEMDWPDHLNDKMANIYLNNYPDLKRGLAGGVEAAKNYWNAQGRNEIILGEKGTLLERNYLLDQFTRYREDEFPELPDFRSS